MPAWLAAALRLMAIGFGGGVAFETGQRALGGSGQFEGATGTGFQNIDVGHRVTDVFRGPHGHDGGRRRRRRRALTASDRADIAFIAGMISKAAAKDFAVQLAARPR